MIFNQVIGVNEVQSGFSGGHVKNPSYYDVCSGKTGHTETIKVNYDPLKVKFEELLYVFFISVMIEPLNMKVVHAYLPLFQILIPYNHQKEKMGQIY